MSRIVIILTAILASVFVSLASPVPSNTTFSQLDKRITHTGRGTWFDVGLGNCGHFNVNSDHILAIAKTLYDENNGGNCGQWVRITANGKTAYGLTMDSCQSCTNNDIDLSPSLFSEFAPQSVGVLHVSWNFMAKGWSP